MVKIVGAFIKKIKNPFNKMGFGRELIYAKEARQKNTEKEKMVQFFSPDKNGAGQIEILHGNGTVARLSFQLGKNLKTRFVEIKPNDFFVDSGFLDAVMVSKDYRRQGLATQMLSELVSHAKRKKGNIYLRVTKTNLNAINLYKKFGFKLVRNLGESEQLLCYYNV